MNFLAIDFETANYDRHSACALSLVRVEEEMIVERHNYLIKPPTTNFHFSYKHGIYLSDVQNAPTFGKLWPTIYYLFVGVDFVVAHNVSFDRSVLEACCETYNIPKPNVKYKCTVNISRKKWNIRPTKLNNVCDHFGIPLDHHEAGSDTLACTRIMLLSLDNGFDRTNINSLQLPVEKINRALLNWRTKRKQNINAEVKKQTNEPKAFSDINSTLYNKPLDQNSSQSNIKKEDSCFMTFIKIVAALIFFYFFVKTCSPSKGRSPWQRNKIPSNKNINEINYLDENMLNPYSFVKIEEYC
ncbi:MAG: 3'-5' exonuclease [Ignavibacteriales bacterium]|nr:3'-5' exonuclease [Ignavibacteriales bacterium]